MEKNERRMHSDFVAGDDESMSEGEGAEPPQAMYARQQIDAAAALFDMPRAERLKNLQDVSARDSLRRLAIQETSRPASAMMPSPAMRRPPPQLGPTAEEEAMADEAQQFAEDTHAATAVQGAVEPPPDHISVQELVDNGTFDEVMQDLASQNFEAMLDGHD